MRASYFAPVVMALSGVLFVVPDARAGGALGGGFLELLATGNSGGQGQMDRSAMVERQVQPMPPMQRAYTTQDPYASPARQAAYQPAPSAQPVQRAIDPKYMRQEVDFTGTETAGSIIVDTPNRYLYFVLGSGRAIRYGIGVGRPGFEWAGIKTVTRKAEWPDWTPPADMLMRRPDLPKHMAGGPENPLGARAMYLGSSLYRLHGTNEPWTIGQNVSSGCIRLMNEDVEDLYDRVKVGAKVRVI